MVSMGSSPAEGRMSLCSSHRKWLRCCENRGRSGSFWKVSEDFKETEGNPKHLQLWAGLNMKEEPGTAHSKDPEGGCGELLESQGGA